LGRRNYVSSPDDRDGEKGVVYRGCQWRDPMKEAELDRQAHQRTNESQRLEGPKDVEHGSQLHAGPAKVFICSESLLERAPVLCGLRSLEDASL
jgi:hypothetical protein